MKNKCNNMLSYKIIHDQGGRTSSVIGYKEDEDEIDEFYCCVFSWDVYGEDEAREMAVRQYLYLKNQ